MQFGLNALELYSKNNENNFAVLNVFKEKFQESNIKNHMTFEQFIQRNNILKYWKMYRQPDLMEYEIIKQEKVKKFNEPFSEKKIMLVFLVSVLLSIILTIILHLIKRIVI